MTSLASRETRRPDTTAVSRRRLDVGLLAGLASAAAFGTSGSVAKALLGAGWSPAAVTLARIGGAAAILLVPALLACRGRWPVVRAHAPLILLFGLLAVGGAQLSYFNAVRTLPVGVALLVEYSGTVLVVLFVWASTRRRPATMVIVGGVVSILGLALVLDIAGQSRPDLTGVLYALGAAVGLAAYFLTASRGEGVLPATVITGFGMLVATLALGALGLARVLPMSFSAAPVTVAGTTMPWWAAVGELVVVAAAAAYLLGTFAARRLGATLASFVGLAEVLFAVLFAWLLLGELPRPVQLVGGLLIVAGVVAVRLGERPAR